MSVASLVFSHDLPPFFMVLVGVVGLAVSGVIWRYYDVLKEPAYSFRHLPGKSVSTRGHGTHILILEHQVPSHKAGYSVTCEV